MAHPGKRRASEATPLLLDPSAPQFSHRRHSLTSHFAEWNFGFPRNNDDEVVVDVDELSSRTARHGSIVSGIGLEPATALYTVQEEIIPGADEPYQQAEESEDPRFINISPKRFWAIFSVIMLAFFVACFDSTLMASSHPVITSYFGASQAAPWLTTAFLISSTASQPLFGRVSDVIGRKSTFAIAVGIFCLSTLWCAVATSIKSFIAARAVCGLGAGVTIAMSFIIVSDLVRVEHRGVFQSYINVAYGTGAAAGAASGGFLCDSIGWRWSFGIQVPLIGVCFIMALFLMPAGLGPMLIKRDGGSLGSVLRSFDHQGSVLLVVAVTTLMLALNLGGNIFPWASPIVISCAVIFAVTAALFLWRETKAKYPLMPLKLLSSAPVANLVFANFFGSIASSTVMFNVPLFFQAVFLTSASESGFRLAVPSIAASSMGFCTGYIIAYTRKLKPTLLAAVILYLIGAIAVLFLSRHVPTFLSLVLIVGVPMGQGFLFPSTMMSALALSKQEDQAVVTTTIGLWRNLGMVMGVALSSVVFQNSLVANLNKLVTGPDKDNIVELVRSSVRSIRLLDPDHQNEGKLLKMVVEIVLTNASNRFV